MKQLLILGVLLLAGCARTETVPTDALVQKWTWENKPEVKNHYCPVCNKKRD